MAKAKSAYVCSECGAHAVKWQGQCPECEAWNSLTRMSVAGATSAAGPTAKRLTELAEYPGKRYSTGFGEFDRVLGGGLVPGSVVLLGGDPGVGKSTLLQQVAAAIPPELAVCYATGEESLRQVGQRAHRLGLSSDTLTFLADTSLDNVLRQAAAEKARVLVVDSIQTMGSSDLPSAPGSVAQLRECVGRLVQFAKQNEIAVFLVGHVTKEGAIAGPRIVEHMVDTVLYFESDLSSRYTVVRAVKNRFGASSEMGVFAMQDRGFREVPNPSAIFLSGSDRDRIGSVVSAVWEGSRPLLVEIQGLVADAVGQQSKRLAQGVDQNRLSLLVAVMQRHGGVVLGAEDIFVNVAGGLKIGETSVDLPVVLAITSSFRNQACADGLLSFGEIGLAGEVRPVKFGTERIEEAAKQGFTRAIIPAANAPKKSVKGIELLPVRNLSEALERAF